MQFAVNKWLLNQGITQAEIDIANSLQYKKYTIWQNNKTRQIEEPCPELKKIQQKIIQIYSDFPFHKAAMALPGKSIITNAAIHQDAKHILRIDVKGCYQNITLPNTIKAIRLFGDNPNPKPMYYWMLVWCFIVKTLGNSHLPTGAPTSPIICNIALTPIDHEVEALVKPLGYNYTRYIDDLHISTTNRRRDWNLISKVTKILYKYHLEPNHKKTQWLNKYNDNIVVTGVQIDKINKVPRDFRRMLRAKLNNAAKDNIGINAELTGCLAYVKSIDEEQYNKFIAYFHTRAKKYEEPTIN